MKTVRFSLRLAAAALVGCQAPESTSVPPVSAIVTIPTDAELLDRFETHREVLERLVRMIRSDGLEMVSAAGPTAPASHRVDDARLAQYRSLLSSSSFGFMTRSVDSTIEVDMVMFEAATRRAGLESWSKGIIASEIPPGELVSSLDDDPVLEHSPGLKVRRIADGWFLFYRHVDDSEAI